VARQVGQTIGRPAPTRPGRKCFSSTASGQPLPVAGEGQAVQTPRNRLPDLDACPWWCPRDGFWPIPQPRGEQPPHRRKMRPDARVWQAQGVAAAAGIVPQGRFSTRTEPEIAFAGKRYHGTDWGKDGTACRQTFDPRPLAAVSIPYPRFTPTTRGEVAPILREGSAQSAAGKLKEVRHRTDPNDPELHHNIDVDAAQVTAVRGERNIRHHVRVARSTKA